MERKKSIKQMIRDILRQEVERLHHVSSSLPSGLDMSEVKKLEALAKIRQIEQNQKPDEDDKNNSMSNKSVEELLKIVTEKDDE